MLLLRRARIPTALVPPALAPASPDPLEPTVLCDVTLSDDRILAVSVSGSAAAKGAAAHDGPDREADPGAQPGMGDSTKAPSSATVDLDGALVLPGLVDAHVHLDKTHSWFRAPNRDGTFMGALATLGRDKVNWTREDLLLRADLGLRSAFAHGTRLVRTHVDTGVGWSETSHAAMAELRERWRGRIDLQTVPLCPAADEADREGEALADMALRHGASALGGFLLMNPALPRQLDRLLAIARERGVGIDLHVDENGNPGAEVLRHVADAVLRNGFGLPVACGHCCSLAVQEPARQRETIARVREARIGVISLPMCNLYLQDRRAGDTPRTPLWRGVTLVHELLDAGVPVACASDNVRDAFHAFGDYDALEVYAQAVRIAHLDTRLEDSIRVVTSAAADLVGRPDLGRIAAGASSHLVLTSAHSFSELLSRPWAPRRLVVGGRILAPETPDLACLAAGRGLVPAP